MSRSSGNRLSQLRPAIIAVVLGASLQACGQTGSLFLPEEPAPGNAPTTSARPAAPARTDDRDSSGSGADSATANPPSDITEPQGEEPDHEDSGR